MARSPGSLRFGVGCCCVGVLIFEPADRPTQPPRGEPPPVRVRQRTDRPTYLPRVVRVSFVSESVPSFDRNGRGGGVCLVSFVSRLLPHLADRSQWFATPLLLWSESPPFGVGCCWCSHFRNCRPTYPTTQGRTSSLLSVFVKRSTDLPPSCRPCFSCLISLSGSRRVHLLTGRGGRCSHLPGLPRLGPDLTDGPTDHPGPLFRFFFCRGGSGYLSGLVWDVVGVFTFEPVEGRPIQPPRDELPRSHPCPSTDKPTYLPRVVRVPSFCFWISVIL